MSLPLAVPVLLLLFGPVVIALSRSASRNQIIASTTLIFVLAAACLAEPALSVRRGDYVLAPIAWLPSLGLDLSLRFDGLSALFALLIIGIGLLIVLYAAYYFDKDHPLARFYALLLFFAGAMLGIVMSDHIILLLVFWEFTSITSFLLIAYKYNSREARIAARMALAVTGGGGLALLAGLLLLGHIGESYAISELLLRGDMIRAHPLYAPMLVLILLGIFTKSAQFPFHFWLPHAMAAPTPVSAYLHSATMVKAGVFLLARLYPVLSGTDLWFVLVSATGAMTFVYGAYVALLKHDFKGLLAYSTISHLGLIVLLFGLDTPMSAVAAVFHIINHAVFKASLFMAAGIIDHECGTRDMRKINGLFRYMPRTAALGMVAAGAMAGVPLLNGFLSKEMFFMEAVGHPAFSGAASIIVPLLATIAGALSVAYSARFVHDVFFNGEPIGLTKTPSEPPRWMRLPIEILVVLVVIVGIAPQLVVGGLLATAIAPLFPAGAPKVHLAVWHGFNLPLVMSIVALGAGLAYYTQRRHLFALQERFRFPLESPVVFERSFEAARCFAQRLAQVASPSLAAYLIAVVATAVGAGFWLWNGHGTAPLSGSLPPDSIDAATLFGALVMVSATALTIRWRRTPLKAVMALGVVGLGVALTFMRHHAPDLALTQLSVEVATIILFLLALRFLPAGMADEARSTKWRDGAVAVSAGAGAGLLVYAMLTRPFETISGYHIAQSVPGGGGTNVVNVTLVDFRGFDTFGEVVVLGMAAIGVLALFASTGRDSGEAARTRPQAIMLTMLAPLLLPLLLTIAAYIFLRGHNLPGGGFIAGLVAAIALVLQFLARGTQETSRQASLSWLTVLGAGILIALATGVVSLLLGYPFLTSAFTYLYPPVIGKFEVASAMAFDVGVFLVVVAAIIIILRRLAELPAQTAPPANLKEPVS